MSDLKKIREEFSIKLKPKLNLSEVNQIKSDLFQEAFLSKQIEIYKKKNNEI